MISEAESDYAAITSKYGLVRRRVLLGTEFLNAVKAAKRRGVRIRIISEIDAFDLQDAESLSRHAEVRELRSLEGENEKQLLKSFYEATKLEGILSSETLDLAVNEESKDRKVFDPFNLR